jgi:gliding motility-associated-like protein
VKFHSRYKRQRKKWIIIVVAIVASSTLCAQAFSFNCTRDSVVLGCAPGSCITLKGIIPDIRALTTSYTLSRPNPAGTCFPVYVQPNDPAGISANLTIDDRYSSVINIGFPFYFYGATYNSLIASTNGFLSFDISKANQTSHWNIINGGVPQNLPSTFYDRAIIMGPYHDLDPSVFTSPTQRIQYQTVGTAPHRRWILSFYKVPLYSGTCNSLIENTHQIILYESTGIVEVSIFSKQICFSWNQGRAMIGMQNFNQNQGVMVPGRRATDAPWGSVGMNETWRFVPAGGAPLFRRVELYDIAGNFISTGSVLDLGNGTLEASFPNVCAPAGAITPYIIKSFYTKIDDPNTEITGADTVRVDRTNAVLNANITSAATACSGASNGSITVTPTNGAAPYTFILNGGTPQSGPVPFTFTNVPAGTHSVVVNDASGCTATLSITVNAGPPLSTSVSKTDALCNGGNTGTITVTQPTMGTPPFEYSLDGINWQTGNTFTGLSAGTYTVYYRESNGCQGSQQVTINEPAAISATFTSVPVVCNGQSNGTITVSASGGTMPFQYSLNGGPFQSNNTFNVSAGTYTVTIRDNNNCTTTQTINVTEPAALTMNLNATSASCDGGNDGTITITASGGNAGYQYSVDGVNFQSSPVFNVGQGNYTITVKDQLGCSITGNITVGLNSNLTFTALADKTICEGTSTQLQFSSNATQYTWSPATGLNNTTIPTPVANPATTTQYIVTATLGLCSINDTVIINVNPAPIPDAGPDGFICYGQSYRLQGSGGVLFSWSPSNYLSNDTISNPVSTPISTITYSLSVTDANGCRSLITDQVTVDVTPPIHVQTYPRDTIIYSGEQVLLQAISGGNMYSWSPATGLNNSNIPDPVATGGAPGDVVMYKVTASTLAGCKGEGYVTVRVYKGPDIYMPTAFTPNGDGRNDLFKPTNVGIKQINYFRIYNRWGQLLFSTSRMNEGWDGTFGGVRQPAGVYVWMIQGVTDNNRIISKKGTVALVR